MKRILLVEDDTPSAFLVQRIIKSLLEDEIQLETTNNGLEGLSKAQTNKYDYAIIDLRLPGVDGSIICSEIKSAHPKTKIALYTAKYLIVLNHFMHEAGFGHH